MKKYLSLFTFIIFSFKSTCQTQAYWENDQAKAAGNYIFESYDECCYGGPCIKKNIYKTGTWTYWYSNGQKQAEGAYVIKTKRISTNCKRKASIHYAVVVAKKWKYWDNSGKAVRINRKTKKIITKLHN